MSLPRNREELLKVFCPTGEGGGIDPTCSPPGAGGKAKLERTGKLPTIAQSPTAFLTKMILEEAKLPDIHYDGLNEIKFVEGQFIQYDIDRTTGRIKEAFGIYSPTERTITLASNARSANTDDFRFNQMGTGNVAVIGGATVLHEIGHHVHMKKLNHEAAQEWKDYSNNGQNAGISAYARTNRGEHFAEAYREYARGGNHRKRLKNLEPKAYQYMQRLNRDPKMFFEVGRYSQDWSRYAD